VLTNDTGVLTVLQFVEAKLMVSSSTLRAGLVGHSSACKVADTSKIRRADGAGMKFAAI
jgi:hypothetical protein